MRRALLILAVVLAVAGLAAGWYLGDRFHGRVQVVAGIVGSEKVPFLRDPRVAEVFARHGLRLTADPRGSREMAVNAPLDRYDFAFPSSAPTAERLRRVRPALDVRTPFSSVLAVATFTPIADLLVAQRLARRTPDGSWVLEVRAFLGLAEREVRWDQLPGNVVYPARREILLTSTHPGDSSSAAMYAWLAATVLRPGPPDGVLLDRLAKLFADQGALERSTEDPFEKYLTQGLNYAPLVLGYEAQYLAAERARLLPKDAALLRLDPTARTDHSIVAYTPLGRQVGELLDTDADLHRLATEYGFRVGVTSATALIATPELAAWESLQSGLDQRLRP